MGVHGLLVGVLGGGGAGEWDADELLSVSWWRVRKALRSESRAVAGDIGGGIKEDKVASVGLRWRRRVGVLDVTSVHEYKSLEAIGCLNFRITMKVRRHRFRVK